MIPPEELKHGVRMPQGDLALLEVFLSDPQAGMPPDGKVRDDLCHFMIEIAPENPHARYHGHTGMFRLGRKEDRIFVTNYATGEIALVHVSWVMEGSEIDHIELFMMNIKMTPGGRSGEDRPPRARKI